MVETNTAMRTRIRHLAAHVNNYVHVEQDRYHYLRIVLRVGNKAVPLTGAISQPLKMEKLCEEWTLHLAEFVDQIDQDRQP